MNVYKIYYKWYRQYDSLSIDCLTERCVYSPLAVSESEEEEEIEEIVIEERHKEVVEKSAPEFVKPLVPDMEIPEGGIARWISVYSLSMGTTFLCTLFSMGTTFQCPFFLLWGLPFSVLFLHVDYLSVYPFSMGTTFHVLFFHGDYLSVYSFFQWFLCSSFWNFLTKPKFHY